MKIDYRKANREDAELLIRIYNAAFYDDYIRYGECPAYGRSKERMEESIEKFEKQIILYDNEPVGVISAEDKGNGEYYVGCLCVIPTYQGKGIGTQAIKHLKEIYPDWMKITLITPVDKEENVRFYTEKNEFRIDGELMDGNVHMKHFIMER